MADKQLGPTLVWVCDECPVLETRSAWDRADTYHCRHPQLGLKHPQTAYGQPRTPNWCPERQPDDEADFRPVDTL